MHENSEQMKQKKISKSKKKERNNEQYAPPAG